MNILDSENYMNNYINIHTYHIYCYTMCEYNQERENDRHEVFKYTNFNKTCSTTKTIFYKCFLFFNWLHDKNLLIIIITLFFKLDSYSKMEEGEDTTILDKLETSIYFFAVSINKDAFLINKNLNFLVQIMD